MFTFVFFVVVVVPGSFNDSTSERICSQCLWSFQQFSWTAQVNTEIKFLKLWTAIQHNVPFIFSFHRGKLGVSGKLCHEWLAVFPCKPGWLPPQIMELGFHNFILFFFCFPPFLTWSSFPTHQAALLYNTRGRNLSHASSEASRQPLFEPLVLWHQRGRCNTFWRKKHRPLLHTQAYRCTWLASDW